MRYTITLIPGDGTGPEVAEAMRRCVEATDIDVEWEVCNAGVDVMEHTCGEDEVELPVGTRDSAAVIG